MAKSKGAGTHEDYGREEEIRGSSDRSFGLVFTVVFTLVGIWPVFFGGDARYWSFPIAAVFLIISFARPSLLAPLNKLWTKFGLLLSKVVNPIIMGLLFYLTITPIGLLMRLMGKDPLKLRFDRNAKSYWIERDPPGPPPETMQNQF